MGGEGMEAPETTHPFSLRLVFDDPELEHRFRLESRRRNRLQNRVAAVFSLLAYVLFAVVDYTVGGEHWRDLLLIRLGLTTPLLGLVIVGFYLRRIADRYSGLLTFAAMLLTGLSLVAMNTRLPPEVQNLYFTGLLVTMVFGHVFFRTDFRWPTAATAILFLAYLAVSLTSSPQPRPHLIASVFYYLSTAFIMIYTGWLLERQERRTFLMQQRLHHQAMTDELTGLANRRAFFGHLDTEWRHAARSGTRLCLLLVDLDHLKEINDSRGHAAGDDALQQLARALSAQARRAGDLAARLSGDEFALLLSGASRERAYEIAKRLAGGFGTLAPEQGLPRLRLTASVGLATTVPTADKTPEKLLGLADAALYEAKAAGRARAVYKVLR